MAEHIARSSRRLLRVAVGIGLALPAAANAAVIVSDGFSDGGRTDGVDAQDAAWYSTASGTTGVTNGVNAVVDGDSSLTYDAGGTFRGVAAPFSAVTLGPAGSATAGVRFSFDFRLRSTTTNSTGFRFGLFNSLGSPFTADNTTTPGSQVNDQGLLVRVPINVTGQAIAVGIDNPSPVSGSGPFGFDTSLAAGDVVNLADTVARSAVLEVVRTSATEASVTATVYSSTGLGGSVLGTATGTTTEVHTGLFTFDWAGVGLGGTSNNFSVDNVVVQTVPEPTTAGLLVAGAVLGLRRRRPAR